MAPDPPDSSRLATITATFLRVAAAVNALAVAAGLYQLTLAERLRQELPVAPSSLDGSDVLSATAGYLQLLVYLATAVPFLLWLRRARRNLDRLGARHLRYAPAWAVWGWFVPLLNFLRPYQVVEVLWTESDRLGSGPARAALVSSAGQTVGTWWALFVAANVLGAVGSRIMWTAGSLAWFMGGATTGLAGDVAAVASALLAVRLVRGVEERQRTAARAGEEDSTEPP